MEAYSFDLNLNDNIWANINRHLYAKSYSKYQTWIWNWAAFEINVYGI